MTRRNYTGYWGGRAMILATVLAVCAVLIPSQASAVPSPRGVKVSESNLYTAASCTFTEEKRDLIAGKVTFKITIAARPLGVNLFKNVFTRVGCFVLDPTSSVALAGEWGEGTTTVNQTRHVTVNLAYVGHFCTDVRTNQRSGATSYYSECIPAQGFPGAGS